jgi:hypothetical protein
LTATPSQALRKSRRKRGKEDKKVETKGALLQSAQYITGGRVVSPKGISGYDGQQFVPLPARSDSINKQVS